MGPEGGGPHAMPRSLGLTAPAGAAALSRECPRAQLVGVRKGFWKGKAAGRQNH